MGYALTSKRQVTIPLKICEQLGIGPGREIDYITGEDGRVYLQSVPGQPNSIAAALDKWSGTSVLKKTTEVIMRATRGEDSMR
jgi:bifunctional DNA-binding transcriptional regulator/antitoxin component of YhaV-PrlF toxin-antitoxin module